ncbi:hypothetical protein NDU88_005970 [Pleurodeles waltl]|uniref:Uncharacterized protein n=1 Tax=Pleurodeles waltl TaxID=8319 RepID=A0AAV7TVV0_PLEWA|nr:hypothetical protein NDU88_005970 [Pleurodeles waltl]
MDAGRHDSRSPCGLFSLLLAATGTPSAVFRRRDSAPLFPGLIGLGRIASFLPCVPLLRGPRTWFRVAAVVGVEGHQTRGIPERNCTARHGFTLIIIIDSLPGCQSGDSSEAADDGQKQDWTATIQRGNFILKMNLDEMAQVDKGN